MKQRVRRRLKIDDDEEEIVIMLAVVERKKKKKETSTIFCFPQYWAVTVANKNTFYNKWNQFVFFSFSFFSQSTIYRNSYTVTISK